MKNKILAIAIPTYNRADILYENINAMLEQIKEYSIPVYISDDSENDETRLAVNRLKSLYEYIYYKKNSPSLGHDLNCISTLEIPSEDYIWYLGDSYSISDGGIAEILSLISSNLPDFISVNSPGRVEMDQRLFSDGRELLTELGWHLTLTGATIYKKQSISRFNKIDLCRCRNFPQTAIIFEYFATNTGASLLWSNKNLLVSAPSKISYWRNRVFDVFGVDWSHFIMTLPQYYSYEEKASSIRMHSDKTGVFSFMSFLSYRSGGIYDLSILKSYYLTIRKVSSVSPAWLYLIALTPMMLLRFARTIKHNLF